MWNRLTKLFEELRSMQNCLTISSPTKGGADHSSMYPLSYEWLFEELRFTSPVVDEGASDYRVVESEIFLLN